MMNGKDEDRLKGEDHFAITYIENTYNTAKECF